MREEVSNWFEQGITDLEAASDNIDTENYYIAAFLAQQAAEKTLKALYIQTERELIKSHNLLDIIKPLSAPETIREACIELNRDYIDTRYPDASVGTPAENYNKKKAQNKLKNAEAIVTWTKKQLTK